MQSAVSNDSQPAFNVWLNRYAVLTAAATFGLICIGGLVTSHEAGMSVPDWPNSYGYNMFLFPPSKWIGGILYEHTHRLLASLVGVLIIALTRWIGGRASRRPLAVVGALEMALGFGILLAWPDLKATGGFLAGIGGLVLLAALVWVRNEPAERPLTLLAWLAFALVQFQGLLGGLRVVLFKDQIGIFHATLAQLFFVLLCVIALLTSRWWALNAARMRNFRFFENAGAISAVRSLRFLAIVVTGLILFQLILGATMRHQHAGLAIPDFPAAYGSLWPATDTASVARYNQQRVELTAVNPITAFQIELQMVHRLVALLILICTAATAWHSRKLRRQSNLPAFAALRIFAIGLFALILAQVGLGAVTILSNKAADVATAHVMTGALSLAAGALLSVISMNYQSGLRTVPVGSAPEAPTESALGVTTSAQSV